MIWGIALLGKYPEQVQFFDTTLRDGEQTPGISLTPPKKLEIARALDTLGVKVIEAGFAAVSQGERKAVELISKDGLEAEICSATRSVIKDIDVAIDAGVDSVNIIIPVSELHIQTKFNKEQDWILDVTTNVVQHAKDRGVIAEICNHVVVMYAGEVVEQGTVQDVFKNPTHPYTIKLLECDPAAISEKSRSLPTIPGEIPDLVSLPEGCVFKNRCDRSIDSCDTITPDWTEFEADHFVSCHLVRR